MNTAGFANENFIKKYQGMTFRPPSFRRPRGELFIPLRIVHCPVRIAGIDGAAQHVYELQTECLAAVGQVSGITDAAEM